MATDKETLRTRLKAKSVQDGDCLMWTGSTLGKHKYGGLKVGRTMLYAHRLSYELSKGKIPDGMVVMHTCDRPACINPDHLVLGTQKENMEDMYSKGRNAPTKGEINGRAKLTSEQVSVIRNRFVPYCRKNGSVAMAREYGVTHQAIRSIVRGKTWKHLA
ncbi:HNH endonuclease signature motif containing protein [Pseudomonas chlororaphis]|uniref:HNH nuclease domain-containing protein n=1 Tax=Pseudomonas chlororaphis O6 TaxID=1037915 RepID=A0AB33WLJ6_9PSED|nr:HNH endonuclease signature motif containing protein [Pseudomonas chlororaphis]EIM13852.1 hypothetical protein PchlO6_2104 [Pseudomonas chlororaphis O6]